MSTASEAETVLAELELSRSVAIQLTVVGTLGFLVSLGLFSGLFGVVTGRPAPSAIRYSGPDWWNAALDGLLFVALATAIIVPHEYVHGLAIRYYGGKPRYGVGLAHFVLPYGYATTDHRFTRDQFVVVALAPLVVLTLVGVALMVAFEWAWLVVPLAANAGGAVGDLWMALTLLGYPPRVDVEDGVTGLRLLGRPDDDPLPHSVTGLVWDTVVGAAAASVGGLFVFGVVGPPVLSALGVEALTVGRPGTLTFLFAFRSSPTEFSYTSGPGVLVLGAALGLLYGFWRSSRRRRTATAGE